MQPTIQSYNQYKVQSTNTTLGPNGSAQIVIGSGLYEIDGSCACVVYNGVTAAAAGNNIYARADCFIPAQSSTIVSWDGNQSLQALNLTAAQLAYAQDLDTFQGRELDQQNLGGSCNSIKKFKKLGQAPTGGGGVKLVQTYQLKHFIPYIWNEQDKYFKVNSMMNVTINFGSTALTDCLAQQSIGAGTSNYGVLSAVAGCTSFDIFFLLKRVTNNVEAAASTISPHITCYLQQKQSLASAAVFNQSFGANQISPKQQMCLIPTDGDGNQFEFEDASSTQAVLPSLTIQRCGVIILQAPIAGQTAGMSDIYEQLQLQKDVNKKDYQNMIHTFHTVFSNNNLQTTFQYSNGGGEPLFAVMGYTYITQLPGQLPI